MWKGRGVRGHACQLRGLVGSGVLTCSNMPEWGIPSALALSPPSRIMGSPCASPCASCAACFGPTR